MDLEVAGADRRLHPVAVAARIGERLRDRRLARAEEAQLTQLGRPGAAEDAAHRFTLERAAHRRWSSAGGPGSTTTTVSPCSSTRPGAVPARPSEIAPSGIVACLLHAGFEVDVGTPEPLGERAGDAADLRVQLLVEPQPDARGSRDELDGAVVVRRAEAAGDDAEVGVRSLRRALRPAPPRGRRRSRSAPARLRGAGARRRGRDRSDPCGRRGRARCR